MAEWENVPLDPKKKKKQQRVNLEPPRPMAARLKKTTTCKPRTAPAYGRAVNYRAFLHKAQSRAMGNTADPS